VAFGGIVGYPNKASIVIKNCKNQGTISAAQASGGIAGWLEYGEIDNCENSGTIISTAIDCNGISGGIVGILDYGSVSNVLNTGEVEVNNYQNNDRNGGIIGHAYGGKVENAYNIGKLTGGDYIGGVSGRLTSPAQLVNTYYYSDNNSLYGVGGTTSNTQGAVERTDKIFTSLSDFLSWLN